MKKLLFIIFLTAFLKVQSQTPYTILISFDGFRWDYSEREITPNLDKLAGQGVSALSLRPCFPTKTYPNHLSIITGCYIEKHGIIANSFADPLTGEEFSLSNRNTVQNEKWYKAKTFWELAEENGIKSASYFFPGSELKNPKRRPSYFHYYDHNLPYEDRIDGVIDWLKLPIKERPKFISLYFHETDSYGHKYGPDAPETNIAIALLDSMLGILMHELENIDLRDSTNIIVLSDHGMTEISTERVVNIEELLNEYEVKIQGEKPFMLIEPDGDEIDEVYEILKLHDEHYSVYKKQKIPEWFHYKNNNAISSILVVAENGWSLVTNDWLESFNKYAGKGNHGYDNNHFDMHGIFYAAGPSFKNNYKTGTVWNIDIFPLLCEIYMLPVSENIDGKSERINFILKENK
ncbi:MAG: alkaline phosphatase family protein [Ignavibacteriae bacterium]|nr:alkaline phosphatase family protein [Ignavibacteriota bacterium]NOG97335.1 alkaline phosphatase family protein [Ignavibacteriota bacterium]